MAHIFISYAKRDTRPLAEALFDALNAIDGLTAWMDKSLEAGSSWAAQIQDELDRADYVVVLLSPDVNRAETATQSRSFVLNEIDYAQHDRKPILPVVVYRTKMPVQIAGVQYIDLTATPLDPTPIVERISRRFGVVSETAAQALKRVFPEAKQVAAETVTATREQERHVAEQLAREKLVEERERHPISSNNAAPTPKPRQKSSLSLPVVGIAVIGVVIMAWLVFSNRNRLPTYRIATEEIIQSAHTAVFANSDWIPTERDFDGVMMVLVPVGCFEMGSDAVGDNEEPVHTQCIENPFWLDKTEVTQAHFRTHGGVNDNGFTGDNRPLERITWFEALEYCEARGGRLPTEAEWEYAARGPNGLVYPWGDAFVADNVVYEGNSNRQTAEVGSRPTGKSWVGALDLSGNVWEWTNTLYQSYPYATDDGREDLTATGRRILRGGSRNSSDLSTRAALRFNSSPNDLNVFIGFRCALS